MSDLKILNMLESQDFIN